MGSSVFAGPRWSPILVAAALLTLPFSREARAEAAAPVETSAPTRDSAEPAKGVDPWADVRRPWLYAPDPTAPPSGHVITALGLGFAQIDRGAARPFAADVARAGAVFSASAEVGVLPFASLHAEGLLAGDGPSVHAGAMLGASVYLLGPRSPVGVVLSGGYLRELGGDDGVWGRAAVAGDLGRFRMILTGLGEHVFSPTGPGAARRDGIDLLLTAGVAYRITDGFHVGAEYVVQDLEGVWDPEEADGGVRHFVGPTATLKLARRIQIGAGPSFGLSRQSPRVLGRMSATYEF